MDVFQKHLLKDETILWEGQPEPSVLFSASDFFLVPFSFLWGGIAIFWEYSALFMKGKSEQDPPAFFMFFGIPFVIMGLYFMFGRFFLQNIIKA